MKKKVERLEYLYKTLKRELVDISINNLVISKEKEHIKYAPSYQRNYIWNTKKAINLIETIFLNGIIPPLTIIKIGKEIEIIDGRQRYETLLRFYNNEFKLKSFGLEKMKELDGCDYENLPSNFKILFKEYKMKAIEYVVEENISITSEDIDMLKRDLFRRYNFGMTALKKSEIARAKYLHDALTNDFVEVFEKDPELYNKCVDILLNKSKKNITNEKEKKNLLLVNIREILVMPYIPIIGEKTIKIGASVIDKYYTKLFMNLNEKQREEKINEFTKIINKIYLIREKLLDTEDVLANSVLFFKSVYWMFSIIYKEYPNEFYKFNIDKFYHYVQDGGQVYFDSYRNITSIHIENRHLYTKRYIEQVLKLDINKYIEKTKENKKLVKPPKVPKLNKNEEHIIGSDKQLITKEEKLEISEIIEHIKTNRFVVQPDYQRVEVKSKAKASRIIESIMLGVKLPPIYLYTKIKENGLSSDIVLDGQQRLISILKFMGEPITDDEYNPIKTFKNKYALTQLKDLDGLEGAFYEEGEKKSIEESRRALIDNYVFDVIRIIERANENVDYVDMFLRLNQNPCPISVNTFEMWNSFDIVKSIQKIKEIAKYKLFNQYGKKMKEEELVTTLAYMDYQEIDLDNIDDFFAIYIYTENKDKQNEHCEIKLSVKNKEGITNYLEEMEPDSNEEKEFLTCLDKVSDFVNKLKILSQNNENILIKIFNPNIKVARKANRKDFYITWLILKELDTHIITTYREELLNDLENIFKYMKNMPADRNTRGFINYINSILDKYLKTN